MADRTPLEEELSDREVQALTDEDRYSIDYHRPERVGDVLFNWFD